MNHNTESAPIVIYIANPDEQTRLSLESSLRETVSQATIQHFDTGTALVKKLKDNRQGIWPDMIMFNGPSPY